jgi:threonine dehydratase
MFMTSDTRSSAAAIPSFREIEAAASRIEAMCEETPLLESPVLNTRLKGRLLVKAECLQKTGSFKLRGAFNRFSMLTEDERRRGAVAVSSGNHGQAVAYAARALGTTAIVVMPTDAPKIKIEAISALGAKVVLHDRDKGDLEDVGREIAETQNLVLVPPANDPAIVAGAGTVGREVVHQAARLGANLDALLVCCGGGGLTAGCAISLRALSPLTAVIAVEPVGFDDTARSLAAGRRMRNVASARTICDALKSPTPAALPFEVHKTHLSGTLAVSDDEVVSAMRTAAREFGLVVEPGGAVALAAVLSGRHDVEGRTVAVTLTGRNIGLDAVARHYGE